MQFSIITPLLNADRHIDRLAASQLAQSHQDWEHILVDGGSEDATLEKLATLCDSDPRFKLLNRPGSSIYQAIFAGIEASTGDTVAWINADDAHTPWALATVAHAMETSGARWTTGFPAAWDKENRLRFVRPQGLYPQGFIRKGYFQADFLGFLQAESMFFSRSLIDQLSDSQRASVLEAKLAGDYRLWRAFAEHEPLTVIPSVLGGFCQHGENRSVTEQADYMAEVYETGTWHPPAWLGRRLGKAFAMLSALRARRLVEMADANLQASISQTPPAS